MNDKIKPINYAQSYVAFLDVLGFKELVYSKKPEDKKKLEKYFHHIEEFITYLKTTPIKSDLDIGYIVISDSIIITVKHSKSNDDNIEILRHLCIAIGFLQSLLSVLDIWLRGGVSSGETYFDKANNQIIGKAYIEAYLLEEKLISNPHVVLDNKIINELGFKNSHELINKINDGLSFDNCGKTILYNWNKTNFIEKEFPLFVDYLSFFFNPSYKTNTKHSEKHIQRIIQNIEENIYSKTALYKKYKWIANYILSIIESNPSSETEKYISELKKL
ncbi:hypothetical protein [Aliarcobacter butzleri]|uniref:hypothetical protein n=1 Tax=Aliarcobacter butzleri TaxID=28197 RepID=UPI001EDA8FB7|nr:hypothetical protein [Aliarcobacter butzleri]MCG3657974.1 hypothetical protein [Aliarcobacter butzleri]